MRLTDKEICTSQLENGIRLANYEDKQNSEVSEKILLATVESSRRLMGWVLHSGSVYRLTDFDESVITKIEDSGTQYTEVFALPSSPSTFYNDRINKILYLRTTGSDNPNGRFIALFFKLFFSNVPINLPFDLGSGKEVHWLPLISNVSKFGVELDNEDQLGNAIEGEGQITFFNDRDFWHSKYDKLIFENRDVEIYSFFDGLEASEAKLIYKGKIKSKSFAPQSITFELSDLISELRAEFPLTNLQDVSGARIPDGLLEAKARQVYGRPHGVVLTSIDQVVDGYPITGTITASSGSPTIAGSGTLFLKEFSPDDKIIIQNEEFTIESVASNTSMTLTEDFAGLGGSGLSAFIIPELPKPWINRIFKAAGHAMSEPVTTVTAFVTLNRFEVASVANLKVGDKIFVSGEYVEIDDISPGGLIKINQNLVSPPSIGSSVKRPPIQNVRINGSIELQFDRDYSVDATNGTLTLEEKAEFNIATTRSLNGTVSFSSSSRSVSGSGTAFESQLRPGDYIRAKNQFDFFEILSIESNTSLTLRTASTYTESGVAGQYRKVNNFNPDEDVLSASLMGATDSGLISGVLLVNGPQIIEDMMDKAGLSSVLNAASFTKSKALAPHHLGLVIPSEFDDTNSPIYRDEIDKINISIFGSLVQNEDFQLEYNILRPNKETTAKKFVEHDILQFTVDTINERVVKTAIVRYLMKEYDFLSGKDSFLSHQKTSDIANFLVKTTRTKTIETLLIDSDSARIFANRWAFLLELGSSIVKLKTKMQGARLQVNDLVDLEHEKLYERVGGGSRKISAIQKIEKNHSEVEIETEDLSNAFNRVAAITVNSAPDFDNSSDDQKFFHGYITDSFGMINNDPDTFGLNLIW